MKQEPEAQLDLSQQPIIIQNQNKIQTEHNCIQQYLSFFNLKQIEQLKHIRRETLLKFPPNIEFCHEEYSRQLSVYISKMSKNQQFFELDVIFGGVKFKNIRIIFFPVQSPTHQSNIENGSNSQIYKCRLKNKKIVIKCYKKKQLLKLGKFPLTKVLKEACLLRLAAALEAGPSLSNMKYDVGVYPDCYEISMEECQMHFQISRWKIYLKSSLIHLKKILLQLHSLQIVHIDIKPQNLCYSSTFGQVIFIDFELSEIIEQELGFKSFINRRGTIGYCGKEMMDLFSTKGNKKIDLYFNDMICLSKTLSQILNEQKQRSESIHDLFGLENLRRIDISSFYQICDIKIDIFLKDNFRIEKNQKILRKEIAKQLFKFTYYLNYSQSIYQLQIILAKIIYTKDQYQIRNKNHMNYCFELNWQSQQIQSNILFEINKMNKPFPVIYFSNHLHPPLQIFQFLKQNVLNTSFSDKIFYYLFAIAISINNTKATLPELEQISQISWTRFQKQIQKNVIKSQRYQKKLFQISTFLFFTCLSQEINERNMKIFYFISHNIFMLGLFDIKKLICYYKDLLMRPMNFRDKIQILIIFSQGYFWIMMNQNSYQRFKQIKIEFKNANKYFLDYCQFSKIEVQLIKLVVEDDSQQYPQSQQIKYLSLLPNQLVCRIKMLLCVKLALNCKFTENVLQNIMKCQENGFNLKNYSLFYFHFIILSQLIIFGQKDSVEKFLDQKKNIFNILQDNNKCLEWRKIYEILKFQQEKSLQNIVGNIFEMAINCRNPIINYLIFLYFNKILVNKYSEIIKLSIEFKQIYIKILILVIVNNEPIQQNKIDQIIILIFNILLRMIRYQKYFINTVYFNKLFRIIKQFYHQIKLYLIERDIDNKNQLLVRLNLLLCLIFIQEKKYKQSFNILKMIYRLIKFIKIKNIDELAIIQFIFSHILQKMQNKQSDGYKRQLYKQFHNVIVVNKGYQFYLSNIGAFIDISIEMLLNEDIKYHFSWKEVIDIYIQIIGRD